MGSWGLFQKIAFVLIQKYNPDLFDFYYNLGRWGNGSSGKRQESKRRLLNLPLALPRLSALELGPICSPGLRALARRREEPHSQPLRSKRGTPPHQPAHPRQVRVQHGSRELCADGCSNFHSNRETRCCSPSQLFARMTAHGIVPCPDARVSHKLDVPAPRDLPSFSLET